MQLFLEMTKSYGKEIWSRKKRLLLSVVVFIVLLSLSFHYLYEGSIDKRVIIFTGLSFLTALLLVLPRLKNKYLSLGTSILYLILVPSKMFQRIELPSHDMGQLIDGAAEVNFLIIFLVYAILLLICQNVGIALGVGGILIGILFVINYYLVLFRGMSLNCADFFAVKTAMTVVGSYEFTISAEFWYSILYFLCFIVTGFWCGFVWDNKKWFHITVTGVSVIYMVCFFYFWNQTDYLEKKELRGIHWIPSLNQPCQGFLLSLGLNMQEMFVEKPAGYSDSALEEIGVQVEDSYESVDLNTTVEQPNIIVIMNESWTDLSVLGEIDTNVSYMSALESMNDNVAKGKLHVSVLGGLTANTEFEVLTGNSMVFLPKNAVPYQLQVNHDVYSLARVLGEQGYQTMAMHPSIEGSWNRAEVYSYFGFDEFVDIYEFETEYDYVRAYISDKCNFNEIIWQYENKQKDQPLFLFDVTIQNHGGYGGGVDRGVYIESLGEADRESWGDITDANTVVNLMKASNDEFARLITYFEQVDEPTIICMFGDHQPLLSDNFYDAIFSGGKLTPKEREERKYITPYVIWSNYDIDLPEYGDMSANYLGAVVLECAGVELPPYYKMLLQLRKEHPVISYQTIGEIEKQEKVVQYEMLQYNHLMDRDSKKELFSVQ